jgi:parvulin-like peptidyl-prolyl isomerase
VGDTAARAAFERRSGETTDPVRSSTGFHVIQVVERTPPSVPPFEEIAELVRSELRRRADDATLRAALASLRGAAEVEVIEVLP